MTELSVPVRLGAFGAGLLVVFGASFGVGRVTGDVDQGPTAPAEQSVDHEEMGS